MSVREDEGLAKATDGTCGPDTAGSRSIAAFVFFLLINLWFYPVVNAMPRPHAGELLSPSALRMALARTWTWWIARAYLDQKEPPNVVLMGSSQMATASFSCDARVLGRTLDCVRFRHAATLASELTCRGRRPIEVFNWSMGAFMAGDAYLVASALFTGTLKPAAVVIGVNPRDFIDNSLESVSATEPFQLFARYVDLGELESVAFPDLMGRLSWLFDRSLPVRLLRPDKIAADAAGQDRVRGQQAPVVLQAVSGAGFKVRPGEWLVPSEMPYLFMDNTREYQYRYRNPDHRVYHGQLAYFEAFLALMKEHSVPVLVIGMPSLAPNRALLPPRFWSAWRSRLKRMCAAHGAEWLDLTADPAFVVDDYLDTVHMNAGGGAKLFEIIARHVSGCKEMATALGLKGEPTPIAASPESAMD